ncbi:MAG: 8-amino-7-oxononanoate synthase [Acidimicrobiales bacterium]|nr:8-amino-7-oxononanoate synthase [Acidimicrobiales bacterium]
MTSSGRTDWDSWVAAELDATRAAGRWRQLRALTGRGPDFTLEGGASVVSFASNDYLGLAAHPQVVEAATRAAHEWGVGTGSSRLIVGDRPLHRDLERALAEWRGEESALVFPTGYHANLAVLTTFARDALIVSDELNHASLIDGARLSRGRVAIFRHGDADHAEELVRSASGRVVVVSDTVFSMDGDVAPVDALAETCRRYGALLVLDDAHAVLGAPAVGIETAHLRVGTLSKALGSQGGFVAGPSSWMHLLVNQARSFIFTTGLSPVCAAAALAAVGVCRSEEGEHLVARLRSHVDVLWPGHPSPILPVVIGDEETAVKASQLLLEQGLLVPAIRPPTVPPGTSRLRISLSAAHRSPDVARLAGALHDLR